MPAKRCPMCHLASEERAWQCGCGYQFGQPIAQVLALLRQQRRSARITLVAMLALDVGALGGLVYAALHGGVLLPLLGLGLLVRYTVGPARTLVVTQDSLAQLEARITPLLPGAIVVARPRSGA